MANYTAIMIHAYGRATGKTIQQSRIDLNIDGVIELKDSEDLDPGDMGLVDELASDVAGVMAWRVGSAHEI